MQLPSQVEEEGVVVGEEVRGAWWWRGSKRGVVVERK